MLYIANAIGLGAVVLFVLSYLLKTRRNIIIFNAASRILYVAQYLLLGAFEGALLDITAFVITILSAKLGGRFVKNHFALTVLLANVLIVAVGMTTYKNVVSILPIAGVIFETSALWLKKEKNIRIVSIFGAPFWLAYNLLNYAYGSAIGNVFTIVSILVAIISYDVLKKEDKRANRV